MNDYETVLNKKATEYLGFKPRNETLGDSSVSRCASQPCFQEKTCGLKSS